ncbi:MAG: glycosyltransferase family 4 protein [Patescibacteria group bacterium]
MKILQISPHFSPNIGGVETHINDLVLGLVDKKHKVFVLAYKALQTKIASSVLERHKRLKILRIPWLPGLFYTFVDKPILEFLYLFPGIFVVSSLIILFDRPDVIHAHGLVAGTTAVIWGKIFGIRTVISTHNIYNFPKSGFYSKFINWVLNKTDHILCLSHQSMGEIKKIVKDKNKISIFVSWVNLKKFKPLDKGESKKKLGWGKQFIVLFVGRLVPEKGISELLSAAKLLSKGIKLKIAGSGPLESKVQKYYIGKISQDDLSIYYSGADIVIVPSTHDEGFGRVILEALACGTPIIASNRGAIPGVIDETVGKLIDVTPINIKRAIEYFYNKPDKLKELSKNTRKFVIKRYGDKNIEAIISSYTSRV